MVSTTVGLKPHGIRLSCLLWPTAILFVATLSLVFATILWTGDSANEVAEEQERGHVTAGLDAVALAAERQVVAQLSGLVRRLDAAGDGAPDEPSAWLKSLTAELGPGSLACLVAPAGEPGFAAVGGAGLPQSARTFIERDRCRSGSDDGDDPLARTVDSGSRLISLSDTLLVETVVRLPPDVRSGRLAAGLLLVVTPLDGSALARAIAKRDLGDLRIERGRPDGAFVTIPDPAGPDRATYLAWRSDRPGDLIRARLVPLSIVGFCIAAVLFAAVFAYLHRVTADLVRSDLQSRELYGRDPLSGLANRLLFNHDLDERLARLPGSGEKLGVLFIDLDRFKDVNDTYGHQAGDLLIQLVAQRLVNLLRETDTLARFGGDEFAVIQTGIRSVEEAETLARRILDALLQPFSLAHSAVVIGASIGIAVAPDHAGDRESLMRLADAALYQAKGEGRNRFTTFQRRMDETLRLRKLVADDLRRAIETDELVLHYQPLLAANGRDVVGLEALVRWPHPVRGTISPADFIWLAEEQGLIMPLGEWVLRRACLDGRRWPGMRIAVNVSPIQFRHRSFVETVERVLAETGFDPTRLELELTEGVVVADADAAEVAMMELRAIGIHLALDDFGTGYSSLIYLRRFAFDTIKIDRSFLESMETTGESAILVHSIVHLGRALGLTVTAEGVETREQHRFLQALGCHQVQGYLFSRPVPADEIGAFLAASGSCSAAA